MPNVGWFIQLISFVSMELRCFRFRQHVSLDLRSSIILGLFLTCVFCVSQFNQKARQVSDRVDGISTGSKFPQKSFLVRQMTRKIMSRKNDEAGNLNFRWNETDGDFLYYNRVPKTGSENFAFVLKKLSEMNGFHHQRHGDPDNRQQSKEAQVP